MLYNDDKSHTQLIQRSAEFLIFMLSEEMLTTSNLTQLWNGTRKGIYFNFLIRGEKKILLLFFDQKKKKFQ